jgi:hypothetical protein
MTTVLLFPYELYIRDTACERRIVEIPPIPQLSVNEANAALVQILTQLGAPTTPITRNGLDAALDILFAHPDIAPLLQTLHPDELATQVLPATHPRFADFWAHIVRPAWDQHVTLAQTVAASGS